MSVFEKARDWDLDLDRYLNRILPPSPLHRFPKPVSRFLGYRRTQRQDVGNVLGAFWSLIGAFCGLAVIAAVFNNTSSIQQHRPPALIASFGASAILEYNAIRSPLGQPRNALLGHTFSALIGVGISKLFQYHSDYESIKWLAGAVACGTSSAVMLLTGTVHPPGGASAVLAATEPVITAMGWYFAGLVLWGTTLMVFVGLVVNNIQRQFPIYWWTPMDLTRPKNNDEETVPNGRGGLERKKTKDKQKYDQDGGRIQITGAEVLLPGDLSLNAEEAKVLERLRERLRRRIDEGDEDESEKLESASERSSTEFTMVPSRSDVGEAPSI
ncbi:HPP family protein [Paraphoma chrysanthemicola]|uniref:HPP family protein n=1 Tax=Paraphoma chrysanthemicola TaxID=798071 RepID=A0A8K0VZ94_9PLEO|nr:HPP family protein [Paraphoma chrysanthemicola]